MTLEGSSNEGSDEELKTFTDIYYLFRYYIVLSMILIISSIILFLAINGSGKPGECNSFDGPFSGYFNVPQTLMDLVFSAHGCTSTFRLPIMIYLFVLTYLAYELNNQILANYNLLDKREKFNFKSLKVANIISTAILFYSYWFMYGLFDDITTSTFDFIISIVLSLSVPIIIAMKGKRPLVLMILVFLIIQFLFSITPARA